MKQTRKPLTNQVPKDEIETRKKGIPKEFIRKIKRLGMKIEDAEVLFKSKINWSAVYTENKIYCVEPGCNYFSKIDSDELTNHMIDVHEYGDYPCDYDHCDYVASSKVIFEFSRQTYFYGHLSYFIWAIKYSENFEISWANAHKAI